MGDRVTFKANATVREGYLSKPAEPARAVVVIQEWWGLVPHIQDVVDRFAAEGFLALAPDLFHGRTTKSPDEAGKLMMSLQIDDAARDLAGAIDHVAAMLPDGHRKVGTIGFCMGGALSLYAAAQN